ncbi:MAG TPA: FaeA/PapI family transcriptional regulator [Gemmatimonadaceae bacterium]|nr:FaeA/PapI family transcriptional regulator [Gemmatimonadaceae bacterium]
MPCVNADGSLTPVAAQVLGALASVPAPATTDAVANAAELPLYRVRSTLRELQLAGLVAEVDANRVLTPEGRARLAAVN